MNRFFRIFASVCILLSSLIFGAPPSPPTAPAAYKEPLPADAAYIYDKIDGADGACFYIGRPDAQGLNTVHSSDFGMSEAKADNTAELNSALSYCAANKGTRLVIDKGVYYFRNGGEIRVSGCENLLVDGCGSKLVFDSFRSYTKLSIVGSRFVEFRNLEVDWDWENDRIGSIVKIIAEDDTNHTMDLEFTELAEVSENFVIKAMTQCDPQTLTMGADGSSKEVYFYQLAYSIENIEKIAPNVLRLTHDGCADIFEKDEVYMLRHHVYDATVFWIGGESSNITFDGVSIFGSAGMAFTASQGCSRFQIKNTYIGVDSAYSDLRHISLGADAIHIVDTNGFFNIEGCDISGMGDDAVNVHDSLAYVTEIVDENTIKAIVKFNAVVGTEVAFKDNNFNSISTRARISAISTVDDISTVSFDRPVTNEIDINYIFYNNECNSGNYVIKNNYFHENRARGLLLQSSNGLCENNRFYKIMGQAIKVIMDIRTGLWLEGTGVDNLVIRGNEFVLCNYSSWGCVIDMGTSFDGRELNSQPFTNVVISGNSFVNCHQYLLIARSANGLTFRNNNAEADSLKNNNGKIRLEKSSFNLDVDDNTIKSASISRENPPQCDGLRVWSDVNTTKLSRIAGN